MVDVRPKFSSATFLQSELAGNPSQILYGRLIFKGSQQGRMQGKGRNIKQYECQERAETVNASNAKRGQK